MAACFSSGSPCCDDLGDSSNCGALADKSDSSSSLVALEPAASNDFEAAFEDFRKTVVVHAREEEDRVFPLLAGLDPDKLHQMATLLAAAKDTAPTASPRTCPA